METILPIDIQQAYQQFFKQFEELQYKHFEEHLFLQSCLESSELELFFLLI